MKLDHFLAPYTKINSKWMKDLNVRQKSIKNPTGENRQQFLDLGCSNLLLNMSTQAREIKAKMNYKDLIKIKSFCTVKETINKTKRQLLEWEKQLANDISDKGLVVAGSMDGVAKDESTNKVQLSEGPHTQVGMRPPE